MSNQKFRSSQLAFLLASILVSSCPVGSASKLDGKHGFTYNRWDKDGNMINMDADVMADDRTNNFNAATSIRETITTFQRQEYACGRAIATKKYRDSLMKSSNHQDRPLKYRPLEIRMPRIIGGDETEQGEFPWTVSVKLNDQPICGGSLIDKSWILTAAHCVVGYNPKNLTIRLGAYRIKDLSEKQSIDIPVGMFIVHKEYSMPRPFSNDIALVKLNDPVEFTDYIIPICLPTEDQASTSSTSLIVNDYSSNRLDLNGARNDEEAGGVVISTKMSDNDIAKCFNQLEQNYLNSIGLGSIGSDGATTEQSLESPTAAAEKNSFAFGDPLNSAIYVSSDMDKGDGAMAQHDNKINFVQQQQQHHKHRLSNNFELPVVASNDRNTYGSNSQYIYYPIGLPWSRARGDFRPPYYQDQAFDNLRRDKIKLSRLPISKELLREIQSVGSSSMPGLNLGLQHGEFMAMASDLAQGGSYSAPSISGTGRETSSSLNRISSNSSRKSSVVRESSAFNDDLDNGIDVEEDPTKYSGLSGIVVGWGWVREIDGEDHIGSANKGYPSVTLQKVKLPILRNNVCEAWFQSQSKKITLLPSQFCAGFNSGGKDACRGDSGGPMIIKDNSDTDRYKLIGIVSAGIGCARPSLPGLYTRVASFIPWINSQLIRY